METMLAEADSETFYYKTDYEILLDDSVHSWDCHWWLQKDILQRNKGERSEVTPLELCPLKLAA